MVHSGDVIKKLSTFRAESVVHVVQVYSMAVLTSSENDGGGEGLSAVHVVQVERECGTSYD